MTISHVSPLSIVIAINELIMKASSHVNVEAPADAIYTALLFVNDDILIPMQRQIEQEDDKKCLEE